MTVELTNSLLDNRARESSETIAQFFKAWQAPKLGYLYRLEFKKFLRAFAIGNFEGCIATNNCSGWSNIERILLYPGESIFDQANYNIVTKTFLSPVINLCGYRVGADKITHFESDGFQYFKGWANGISNEELNRLSLGTESAGMGQTYTEVVSYADHNANMIGIQFYRTFFEGTDSYIAMGPERRLIVRRPIDICEFVSELWDETTVGNENVYTGARAPFLAEAIANRLENSNSNRISKHELMNRTYKEPPVLDQAVSGGLFYFPSKSIRIPVQKNSVSTYTNMPDLDPQSVSNREMYIRSINPD